MDNKSALRMKPLIVKKGNIRILKNHKSFTAGELFKEDVLYDTTDMYFLKGEYQRLLLVNRFNIVKKQSRAVAKYYSKDGTVVEKTSDRVTELIGQEQFKTVFTAVCSIMDQELKIRSILALLTLKVSDKKVTEKSDVRNDIKKSPMKILMDNSCQTDEMRISMQLKPKRRMRTPVSPYIIQDVEKDKDKDKQNPEKSPCVPEMNVQEEKKKPKKLIINVRKVNHINPETLEKVTLRSEMSIAPFDDDQDQGYGGQNFDPLSTGQKNDSMNLTDLSAQKYDYNNLTNLENQNHNSTAVLTSLDGQNHCLTNVQTQKHNSVGSLTDLETQKHTSIGPLTELGYLEEFSNDGSGRLSALSETSIDTSLLNNIDIHTKIQTNIVKIGYRVPGTNITVPYKPEDMFHIATKDNLQHLDNDNKKKLLQHQLMIDFENCLNVMDEDGNLPIHLAVLNDDSELLIRQCIVLKMRGSSIDIPENGPTALKLAVEMGRSALAASLVRHGACPLRTDAAHRAFTHDAAEKDPDVLRAVLTVCRENARKILFENGDLWRPEMEKQSDEELAKYLMKHMCSMFNKQGYNPLMLASSLGLYENVRILIEHSPNLNDKMPTCGNTALYLAIAAACNSSIELGNKSKVVDHFRKTIELLLQHGADPCIDNNYGTNVHTLLQEFNIQELCLLVANKQYLQLLNKKVAIPRVTPIETDVAKVMLVMGRDGDIQCKSINERNITKKCTDKNLVIVADVILKPGNTAKDGNSIVDEPKVNSKNVKVFQIRDNVPEKVATLTTSRKNQAVKRKQSDAPNLIKQAKINK